MKVYVVLELGKDYNEIFVDVFAKKPEAVEFVQEKYVVPEKMNNCSSKDTLYKVIWPPGASEKYIQSQRYIYIREKDI